ncbi:hypothetical protein [Ruminococcus sp.]
MKKVAILSAAILITSLFGSCSDNSDYTAEIKTTTAPQTTASEPTTETTAEKVTAAQLEVGFKGMEAVYADSVKSGEYDIKVDSSSSMFKITACKLVVADGKMTAKMTMSGSGYEYLYMGTEEEAGKAVESDRIAAETADDVVSFTVPVEALDKEIDCAAFSRRKEQWYGRKLVFRADSLPKEAFSEDMFVTVDSLSLEDGEYMVDVKLEGGSGKASVQSPAKLTIKDGKAFAEIVWSSNKYDYMVVGGDKIMPVSTDELSVFEIPVEGFDYKMKISADTTAMSTPHEIEYTLFFDSASVNK